VRRSPDLDAADLCRLAELLARLTPAQQRLVATLSEGLRSGWLDPSTWQRLWQRCDLTDDGSSARPARGWSAGPVPRPPPSTTPPTSRPPRQ
jgi:hypothetical protein